MRRLLWLGIGLALGVLIYRKLARAAAHLTPSGLAQTASEAFATLAETARDFASDVRTATAEREATLRAAAELDGGRLGSADQHPA